MYIPGTFKCNGCGRERTASNGWYELHISESSDAGEPSLMILSFGGNESGFVEHYCGAGCLLPAISTRLRLLHPPVRSRSEAPVEPEAPVVPEPVPLTVCTCSFVPGDARVDPFCGVHGHAGF